MSVAGSNKPSPPPETIPINPWRFWEYADVGFDTEKKLWVITFFNDIGQNVGAYLAKTIVLKNGNAIQYQWKDPQARPTWHVRERFFPDEIENMEIDVKTHELSLSFKVNSGPIETTAPQDYEYLLYAYHLSNREGNSENKAPMGFLEFYDSNNRALRRLNNCWIVVEGALRKTVGDFPKIRIRVDRKDVSNIIITKTVAIIQGRAEQK